MKTIQINQQPVELYKILKFESLVDGGGEAKNAIVSGLVTLNNQVETQKRKKVYVDDIVEFAGQRYLITLKQTNTAAVTVDQSYPTADQSQPTKPVKKRSSINF